jgi:hypothetical protein
MDVLEAIQLQIWSHHRIHTVEEQALSENLLLAADDLVPIVTYVLSQSPSVHLCSELAFIERFADEGALLGEHGY